MDFFEFHEKLTQRPPKPEPTSEPGKAQRQILTVTQLTAKIEKAIKDSFPAAVVVQGEVSNLKHHGGSGHWYFTLKDANACIDCVMFKSDAARLKFTPEDGVELLATGHVAVYPQRGRYQLYVSRLELVGKGALELAFRQLCAKLEREGLFAAARKKALPPYPMRVALVSSLHTAAIQDMLKVLRRFGWVSVLIYDVPVQGEGAAERIASALSDLNRRWADLGGIDLILLGRGGGSLEELWDFNEEIVARAIVASSIPIVTGIGHEIDVSIADLAADYHAHTPTEAAQVAMARWRAARDLIETLGIRLRREIRTVSAEARRRLLELRRHEVFRRPMDQVNRARQVLDDRQRGLAQAMKGRLQAMRAAMHPLVSRLEQLHPRHRLVLHRQRLTNLVDRLAQAMRNLQAMRSRRLGALAAQLHAVGPQQVLGRGYSITRIKKTGALVRDAKQVKEGDRLITRVADGEVQSTVNDSKQMELFE